LHLKWAESRQLRKELMADGLSSTTADGSLLTVVPETPCSRDSLLAFCNIFEGTLRIASNAPQSRPSLPLDQQTLESNPSKASRQQDTAVSVHLLLVPSFKIQSTGR